MGINIEKIKKVFIVILTVLTAMLVIYALYANKSRFYNPETVKYSQCIIRLNPDTNSGNKWTSNPVFYGHPFRK